MQLPPELDSSGSRQVFFTRFNVAPRPTLLSVWDVKPRNEITRLSNHLNVQLSQVSLMETGQSLAM
jgi:hypothetical protein